MKLEDMPVRRWVHETVYEALAQGESTPSRDELVRMLELSSFEARTQKPDAP